MSNFNVQQVKPAVLKSKQVATLVDVEQVKTKVDAVEEVHPGGTDRSTVTLSTFVPSGSEEAVLVTVEGSVQFNGSCTHKVYVEVVDTKGKVRHTHTGMALTHLTLIAKTYTLTTSFILLPYHTTTTVGGPYNVPSVKPSSIDDKVRVRLLRTSGKGTTLNSVRVTTTKTIV